MWSGVTRWSTCGASKAAADETGTNPGEFTLTRTGDTTTPLTVNYGVGGSAVNGFDYPPLLGSVVIPAALRPFMGGREVIAARA